MNTNAFNDNLPLSETTVLIMLCMAPEPRHGYGIMKDVEVLSQSRIRLSTGTLYGALKRLLDQGWIERVAGQPEAVPGPGRPRKTYALTEPGRRVLDAEVERMKALVVVARQRIVEAGA